MSNRNTSLDQELCHSEDRTLNDLISFQHTKVLLKPVESFVIILIIMAYPVVRDDGHGAARNPPRIIFGCLLSNFIGSLLSFAAGNFSHEVSVVVNAFKSRFNTSRKCSFGRPVGRGAWGSSLHTTCFGKWLSSIRHTWQVHRRRRCFTILITTPQANLVPNEQQGSQNYV